METKIIHVTNGFNWGKFMLGQFTAEERAHPDLTGMGGFLNTRWGEQHVWVMDLETGEGALFRHGGLATYDLNSKHQIWVCPMFEPFLVWLYKQPLVFDALPDVVTLTEEEAPSSMAGYRRRGPIECSGCHCKYVPNRRPPEGKRHYCPDCGITAARRDAARDYRKRQKEKVA